MIQFTAGQAIKLERVLGSRSSSQAKATEDFNRQHSLKIIITTLDIQPLKGNYFIMYLSVCMRAQVHRYMQMPTEATLKCQMPWSWSTRQL